jgi:hypothetical protein
MATSLAGSGLLWLVLADGKTIGLLETRPLPVFIHRDRRWFGWQTVTTSRSYWIFGCHVCFHHRNEDVGLVRPTSSTETSIDVQTAARPGPARARLSPARLSPTC